MLLLGIYLLCILAAPLLGTGQASGAAVLTGAEEAVRFCLSLGGAVCLWSGVMELMERCGLSAALGRAVLPLLRRLFPRASCDGATLAALSENLSANLLGLGNAATPAGIRAAQGMARQSGGEPSDELCTLVVLNTASLQFVPTTAAALRASLGAASAFDILPAVWCSSLCALGAGLISAALLRRLWP